MHIIFYISSAVALIAAFMAITGTNAVHALLYLIVSLLSVAFVFFILGAPFAAALEIIIYAGAIMVLFIFVIMMLNLGKKSTEEESKLLSRRIWIGPSILTVILLLEFIYALFIKNELPFSPALVAPKEVGVSLFSTYLLGVELAGILLMAGIIGAYHLGRSIKKTYHRFLKGDPE